MVGILLLFFLGCAVPQSASAVTLVKDARAVAKIFVEDDDLADMPVRPGVKRGTPGMVALAVEDLNYHIEKMSGVPLEVVKTSDPGQVTGPAIVIGKLAEKLGDAVPATKWKEGYRIVVKGDRVLIAGETPRGTSHGIYAFLRDLGCDWVMPTTLGEIIPEKKTITVADRDQASSPDFGIRRFWYRGEASIVTKEEKADYDQWVRRQQLGRADEFSDDREGHYWGDFVSRNKKEIEADPEVLALVRLRDGTLVRKGPQIETTNPKVARMMAADIGKWFETRKWPKDKPVSLPIGPADGDGYSVSPASLALVGGRKDALFGGPDVTEPVAQLANDVLAQLGDEYPRLKLNYYVYSVHAGYPSEHKPDPRINPIFAPISYSRFHSTLDPHSKSRAFYRQVVEKWGELAKAQGNQLNVYEYNWNLADNMLPFTRVRMFGEDIPFYHRMNFSGFTLESTKAWAINGPHDYIAARLVWDASLDWKKLLTEYCVKAFGPAAPMMERYYLRLAEVQSVAGQEAGSYYSAPLIFDAAFLDAAQKDLDEALAQKLSPDERVRTASAALPLQTLRHYLEWHQAMGDFAFEKAKSALDAALATWQKQLDANTQLAAREVPGYVQGLLAATTDAAVKYSTAPYAIVWKFPESLPTAIDPGRVGEESGFPVSGVDAGQMDRLARSSAEEGAKYSTAPYEVVWKLPGQLLTALDPSGEGGKLNLAAPEINDSGWVVTRVSREGWTPQGLGFYQDGAVWYRTRFEIPKTAEKRAIGLFLGGFDDEARVWVNGKPVGSSGVRFGKPAVFDLTGAIREDGENLLAIQVIRHSRDSKKFVGGLFDPGFVFAGPRVAPPEKAAADSGPPAAETVPAGPGSLTAPDLDESGWMKTRTWGSTWDAQGLGFYRNGSVWYRTRFELPKAVANQPIGLFLGGFDDEARVWLNGKAIGSSGVKFAQPAVMDLTGAVHYDKENVLAIEIVRNSQLNEILTGGILRPCFVFTGPRVAPSEKRADPEFRILPEGAPPKPTEPEKRVLPGGVVE